MFAALAETKFNFIALLDYSGKSLDLSLFLETKSLEGSENSLNCQHAHHVHIYYAKNKFLLKMFSLKPVFLS